MRFSLQLKVLVKALSLAVTTLLNLRSGADMSFGLPFQYMHNAFAASDSGSLSAYGDRYADERQLKQQGKLNALTIQQEKDSIIGRVDAAKAAGIHPLVAMGAQGLGGPVVSAGSPSQDPGTSYFTPTTRPAERSDDQRRFDKAQADLAEVNVQLANKKLTEQPGNGGAPNQLTGNNMVVPAEATPHPVSHVKIEGQTLPPASMANRHQTPGVAPGWDVVQIGTTDSGRPVRMVVPGGAVQRENWGEQLGELPIALWPEVARQSAKASNMSVSEWLWQITTGTERRGPPGPLGVPYLSQQFPLPKRKE